MMNKFPAVNVFAVVVRATGILTAFFGVIAVLWGFGDLASSQGRQFQVDAALTAAAAFTKIVIGIAGIAIGGAQVLIAELAHVFLAIEANTARAAMAVSHGVLADSAPNEQRATAEGTVATTAASAEPSACVHQFLFIGRGPAQCLRCGLTQE